MTSAKARINKIFTLSRGRSQSAKSESFIKRFSELLEKGLVLCKDGVVRTRAEWLNTTQPEVQNFFSSSGEGNQDERSL